MAKKALKKAYKKEIALELKKNTSVKRNIMKMKRGCNSDTRTYRFG